MMRRIVIALVAMLCLLPAMAQATIIPTFGFGISETREGIVPKPPLTLGLTAIPPIIGNGTAEDQQAGAGNAVSDNIMIPCDTDKVLEQLVTAGIPFKMDKVGNGLIMEGITIELDPLEYRTVTDDSRREGSFATNDFTTIGRNGRQLGQFWQTPIRGEYVPNVLGNRELQYNQSPIRLLCAIPAPSKSGKRYYVTLVPCEDRRDLRMFLVSIPGKSAKYLPIVFSITWTPRNPTPYRSWVEWAARTRGFEFDPTWEMRIQAYRSQQMAQIQAEFIPAPAAAQTNNEVAELRHAVEQLREELKQSRERGDHHQPISAGPDGVDGHATNTAKPATLSFWVDVLRGHMEGGRFVSDGRWIDYSGRALVRYFASEEEARKAPAPRFDPYGGHPSDTDTYEILGIENGISSPVRSKIVPMGSRFITVWISGVKPTQTDRGGWSSPKVVSIDQVRESGLPEFRIVTR